MSRQLAFVGWVAIAVTVWAGVTGHDQIVFHAQGVLLGVILWSYFVERKGR